jgi:ABC-type uncharacterized transport system permease subunit
LFDLRLLRPTSVLKQYLFEELGLNLAKFLIMFSLLYLLFFPVATHTINFRFLILAFLLAFLSHYFLMFSVGLTVFWAGDSRPFSWVVSKLIMISQVVPHHFIPKNFSTNFRLVTRKIHSLFSCDNGNKRKILY